MKKMVKISRVIVGVIVDRFSQLVRGNVQAPAVKHNTTSSEVSDIRTQVLWKVSRAPSRSDIETLMVMSLAATLPKPTSLKAMYDGIALSTSHSP
jgi:hypothetical protein